MGRHLALLALLAPAGFAACRGGNDHAGDAGTNDAGASSTDTPVIRDSEAVEDGGVVKDGGAPLDDCPVGPAPDLPADSPSILFVGSSERTELIASHLRGLLAGDVTFKAPEVVVQLTDCGEDKDASLLSFWYVPEGREARLATLGGRHTWVVILESNGVAWPTPELDFEGVRVVSCRARMAGAEPLIVQGWTDSADFTEARGDVAYRVGNGTGVPVVPSGYAWASALRAEDAGAPSWSDAGSNPDAGPTERYIEHWPARGAFAVAASVYSTITGKSAASTAYRPPDITPELAAVSASAAHDAVVTHANVTHYTSPYPSAVQLRTMSSKALRFATAGTSSEALWADRMKEIAPRLGLAPAVTDLGACNERKTFDPACLDATVPTLAGAQYGILFARDYRVAATSIADAGGQDDLQAQIWDRHPDGFPTDGAELLADIGGRSWWTSSLARQLGLAWLPHHLMVAKLKLARPGVQVTSDGTHATFPVSYALATMSLVSRTSMHVPTDGLDPDTAAAVRLAEQTIRQLATLSRSGVYVPDDPATRPRVR